MTAPDDTLKIFNLLKNDYIYQISNEDRDIMKEKIINSYYSQSAKDNLLFELNKEKINLKTIENMISVESANNSRFKDIKKSMFFNISLYPITFFIYITFLVVLKEYVSFNFFYITGFSIFMILISFLGVNFFKYLLLLGEKKDLEDCDDIKICFFKITLNNHKIKAMILNELKNTIESINKITGGNKKAVNFCEDYYYEIEEKLLTKDMNSFLNIQDNLKYLNDLEDYLFVYLDLEEEYKELYKSYNEVKNDGLLALHY